MGDFSVNIYVKSNIICENSLIANYLGLNIPAITMSCILI